MAYQGKIMKKITIAFIMLIQFGYSQDHYYYKDNTKVSLKAYKSNTGNTTKVNYYKNEKGILLGITDKIIIKVDEVNLKQYTQEFNLTIEKKLSANLYLLKVSDRNTTLNIANSLSQKEGVKYAHPDFIKKRILR